MFVNSFESIESASHADFRFTLANLALSFYSFDCNYTTFMSSCVIYGEFVVIKMRADYDNVYTRTIGDKHE